jgi:hypothetical protein
LKAEFSIFTLHLTLLPSRVCDLHLHSYFTSGCRRVCDPTSTYYSAKC